MRERESEREREREKEKQTGRKNGKKKITKKWQVKSLKNISLRSFQFFLVSNIL